MKNLIQKAQLLTKLGDEFIEKKGAISFHLAAADLLIKHNIADDFNYPDLIESSFTDDIPKHQNFSSLEFSDLPFTIARGTHCFIDIYLWRRRPTVIHNHHFTGAFQCMDGLNVDSQFSYKKTRDLGSFHSVGELTLTKTTTMKKGDVESISFQDDFIHQNHHQAELTANLCFRVSEQPKTNIANFLFSGLRYEKDKNTLNRCERLLRLTGIEEFDYKKIDLTHDDALCFLLQTYQFDSNNKRFHDLRNFLKDKVSKELDMNMDDLLDKHEAELDRIQELYQ